MTLTLVRVRDLQSIHEANIRVGGLTVVIGESNVGKSALVRAIHLLARNGTSTGLVRKGADNLAVSALFADAPVEGVADNTTVIQIRRGPRLSEYKIKRHGAIEQFTKCGTGVPAEVTDYLKLASSDLGELSFAGQHDAPFLLSQPASSVARQIGAITNAHLLNDAVRETNRRRLEATQEVRSFTREAEECRQSMSAAPALKLRKEALVACQDALDEAVAAEAKRAALALVVQYAGSLQEEITALSSAGGPSEKLTALVSEASAKATQITAVTAITAKAKSLAQLVKQEESAAREWAHGAEQIEQDAHRMLTEAGVCPACGQEVAS